MHNISHIMGGISNKIYNSAWNFVRRKKKLNILFTYPFLTIDGLFTNLL